MRIACVLMLAVLTFAAQTATGATPGVGTCLQLTAASGLRSAAIVKDLGLTPDQAREVRSRLSSYNSVRGFEGLDGIGLTAEQIAEIQRRIDVQVAAMNAHPLGWPCKVFKNKTKVIAFVRKTLLANGYRPNMKVWATSPRQIQLRAIQDGVKQWGAVVRTGPREVTFRLLAVGWGQTKRFTVSFEP